MNYYNLQQYKKASFYLEKATYSPKNFFGKNNDPVDKILFFSERDFALGNSLIKIGEIKKGIMSKLFIRKTACHMFRKVLRHLKTAKT